MQAAVEEAEQELLGLQKELSEVKEQEKAEMSQWLAHYGVQKLVHTERISVLKSAEERLAARSEQLAEDGDLLAISQDFLGWIQTL